MVDHLVTGHVGQAGHRGHWSSGSLSSVSWVIVTCVMGQGDSEFVGYGSCTWIMCDRREGIFINR